MDQSLRRPATRSLRVVLPLLVIGALIPAIGLWRGWFGAPLPPPPPSDDDPPPWVEALPPDLPVWRQRTVIEVDLDPAWGLTRHPSGDLVACGDGGLRRRRSDGTWSAPATGHDLRAVTCAADGRYFACSGARVLVFAPDGALKASWDYGPEARLDAIAVAGEYVFVADGGTRQVHRSDRHGEKRRSWGQRTGRPDQDLKVPGPWFDLSWDAETDTLWVVNPGRHLLLAYDADGNLQNLFGGASLRDPARFVGCCNPVAIDILSDGNLVTTEKGACRAKVLDTNGRLLAIIAFPRDFGLVRKRRRFAVDVLADSDGVWLLERDTARLLRYEPASRL